MRRGNRDMIEGNVHPAVPATAATASNRQRDRGQGKMKDKSGGQARKALAPLPLATHKRQLFEIAMNQVVIPLPVQDIGKARKRRQPKGRQPDPAALAEVQALLGDAPRRRDLLIEHLHAINDHYGQLAIPHLVALAQEMGLSMAEVYEVATFYHHFDVV